MWMMLFVKTCVCTVVVMAVLVGLVFDVLYSRLYITSAMIDVSLFDQCNAC